VKTTTRIKKSIERVMLKRPELPAQPVPATAVKPYTYYRHDILALDWAEYQEWHRLFQNRYLHANNGRETVIDDLLRLAQLEEKMLVDQETVTRWREEFIQGHDQGLFGVDLPPAGLRYFVNSQLFLMATPDMDQTVNVTFVLVRWAWQNWEALRELGK
jgi:hypothetical protein